MFYVLDEKGNKVEGYDKQGFLSVLQQAIANGDLTGIDADSAFVSKMKCCVDGGTFNMAFVTEAKYNELRLSGQLMSNTLYFITDDNTEANLEAAMQALQADFDGLTGDNGTLAKIMSGEVKVGDSNKLNGVKIIKDENGVLRIPSNNPLAWYQIIEEVANADGVTKIRVGTNAQHKIGDIITYQGDTAKIVETNFDEGPDRYTVNTATGNAFCKAIGTTIAVGEPEFVIPQKKLLWQGTCVIPATTENPAYTTFNIIAGNLLNRKLQLVIELGKAGTSEITYKRQIVLNPFVFFENTGHSINVPLMNISFVGDGEKEVAWLNISVANNTSLTLSHTCVGTTINNVRLVGVYEIIE